jgi:hypothetical protein
MLIINILNKSLKEEEETKALFEGVLNGGRYSTDKYAIRQAKGSLPSCYKRIEELKKSIDIYSKI